jgi:hypothetical protein
MLVVLALSVSLLPLLSFSELDKVQQHRSEQAMVLAMMHTQTHLLYRKEIRRWLSR